MVKKVKGERGERFEEFILPTACLQFYSPSTGSTLALL